jgi:opacity protein-like surface antigen
MNSRAHTPFRRFLLVIVALAVSAAVVATVALANDRPEASPNPVTFSGAGFQEVTIHNPSSATAQWQVSISAGASTFRLAGSTSSCVHVNPGASCRVRVQYAPSGAAEDRGTLLVRDRLVRSNSLNVDLIGHPGSGGGGGGGGNGPNCTMHTARNQKLVKGSTKKPYQVAMLENEDGTVSASASGKTKGGKSMSLNSASSAATAGNGVVLKLKLGKASEKRIRSELAAGRKPKMKLRGQCKGTSGVTVETATLHFKAGKGKTLIADAKP